MSSHPDTPTLLGGVAASVAHELNNQLAILMGRAELLHEDLAGQPALAEDARVIREAAAHSHRAVQALVGLVRPRPGAPLVHDLNESLAAAVAMLAYTLRTGGVTPELVPDPATPRVRAEAGALMQLLLGACFLAQRAARETPQPRLQVQVAGPALWLVMPDPAAGERAELEGLASAAGATLVPQGGRWVLRFAPA